MWTLAFWKATAERALKTAAQAPLTAWLVGDVAVDAFNIGWTEAAGLALGGALVSVLTSVASAPVGSAGPSLGGEQLKE